jgi:hypothetical protein
LVSDLPAFTEGKDELRLKSFRQYAILLSKGQGRVLVVIAGLSRYSTPMNRGAESEVKPIDKEVNVFKRDRS